MHCGQWNRSIETIRRSILESFSEFEIHVHERENQKLQSKIDNLETLARLDAQDTGRRQANTTKKTKKKKSSTGLTKKTVVNPGAFEW